MSRDQFADVAARLRAAVMAGGVLGFTLKEGDGEACWRAGALRSMLETAGWSVVDLRHVVGRLEPWIHVLAR